MKKSNLVLQALVILIMATSCPDVTYNHIYINCDDPSHITQECQECQKEIIIIPNDCPDPASECVTKVSDDIAQVYSFADEECLNFNCSGFGHSGVARDGYNSAIMESWLARDGEIHTSSVNVQHPVRLRPLVGGIDRVFYPCFNEDDRRAARNHVKEILNSIHGSELEKE